MAAGSEHGDGGRGETPAAGDVLADPPSVAGATAVRPPLSPRAPRGGAGASAGGPAPVMETPNSAPADLQAAWAASAETVAATVATAVESAMRQLFVAGVVSPGPAVPVAAPVHGLTRAIDAAVPAAEQSRFARAEGEEFESPPGALAGEPALPAADAEVGTVTSASPRRSASPAPSVNESEAAPSLVSSPSLDEVDDEEESEEEPPVHYVGAAAAAARAAEAAAAGGGGALYVPPQRRGLGAVARAGEAAAGSLWRAADERPGGHSPEAGTAPQGGWTPAPEAGPFAAAGAMLPGATVLRTAHAATQGHGTGTDGMPREESTRRFRPERPMEEPTPPPAPVVSPGELPAAARATLLPAAVPGGAPMAPNMTTSQFSCAPVLSGWGGEMSLSEMNKAVQRMVQLPVLRTFGGAEDFDVSTAKAHANFDWLLEALAYTEALARQLQVARLPEPTAINIISSRFTDGAAEWFRSIVARLRNTAEPQRYILVGERVGNVLTVLGDFEAAFVHRWLPYRFPSFVRQEFEAMRLRRAEPDAVRRFAAQFDLTVAKLRVLGITYTDYSLAERMETALQTAPRLLSFLQDKSVLVYGVAGQPPVHKPAISCYAGMVEGIRAWLQTRSVTARGSREAADGETSKPRWRFGAAGGRLHAMDAEEAGGDLEAAGDEREAPRSEEADVASLLLLEQEADDVDRLEAIRESLVAMGGESESAWAGQVAELAAIVAEKREQLICYNCNKPGHVGRQCPEARTEAYTLFLKQAAEERARRQAGQGGAAAAPRPPKQPASWPPMPRGRGRGGS